MFGNKTSNTSRSKSFHPTVKNPMIKVGQSRETFRKSGDCQAGKLYGSATKHQCNPRDRSDHKVNYTPSHLLPWSDDKWHKYLERFVVANKARNWESLQCLFPNFLSSDHHWRWFDVPLQCSIDVQMRASSSKVEYLWNFCQNAQVPWGLSLDQPTPQMDHNIRVSRHSAIELDEYM